VARPKEIGALFAKVRASDKRLYDWMLAHHDELVAELGSGRVLWHPVMQVIAELGLVDDRGRQPTRDTAFRTWHRVRNNVAKTRAERQDKPALKAGEISPGVRSLLNQNDQPDVKAPRMRLDIRPAIPVGRNLGSTFRTEGLPTITSGAASVIDTRPVEEVSAEIQRVFAAIGATRTPMPKIVR
jgi:hypothetical protein